MVILHIAFILDNPCNGVCVAVPQHVRAQAQWADVGFLNVQGSVIPGLKEQLPYSEPFCLESLPGVFSKPDLVVFHDVYRPPFLPIARHLRKRGVPYIIVPHGCLGREAQRKKWLKKKLGNLFLFGSFIRGAAAIQCLSELEQKNTGFSVRKFVGTNGIAIPEDHKISFRQEAVQITYIGRLDAYHKGLDLLLDAVQKQKAFLQSRGCKLRMFGPDYRGRYAHVAEMIRERNLEDVVTLQPAVSGAEKKAVLLDSDLFIQSSRFEGMPLGILEAMAYGIPCIVTEGTNLRRFIEDNHTGWGAENTAQSVGEAIVRAVNERNSWEEKSVNARSAVQRAFDWNVIAKETLVVYRELVKE